MQLRDLSPGGAIGAEQAGGHLLDGWNAFGLKHGDRQTAVDLY